MRALFIPLTIVLFVAACGPRDVPVERTGGSGGYKGAGGGSGVDKKKSFVLTQEGQRSDTCPSDKEDFTKVYIQEEDRDQVLAGEITASLEASNRNCFRIGSQVQVMVGSDVIAEATVTKTEGLLLSRIKKDHEVALGHSIDEIKQRGQDAIDKLKAKNNVDSYNMISVTYFELPNQDPSGGATTKPIEITTLLSFDQEGQRSSTCPEKATDWTRIGITPERDQELASGQLRAWVDVGDLNCFKVGSIAQIQADKSSPVRGQVKITLVQVLPIAKLNVTHAAAMNMSLVDLKKAVADLLEKSTKNHKDAINVTFFEVVSMGDSSPQK